MAKSKTARKAPVRKAAKKAIPVPRRAVKKAAAKKAKPKDFTAANGKKYKFDIPGKLPTKLLIDRRDALNRELARRK